MAFPKPSSFPLAWVGLAPYLYFLTAQPSKRRLALGHALFSLAFFGGILAWLPAESGSFGGIWVWSGLVLLLGTLTLPFPFLTRFAARRSIDLALACAPGLWIGVELLRSRLDAEHIGWGLLGDSQAPFTCLAQVSDLGGVHLVSFLLVSLSSLIVIGLRCTSLRLQLALAALLAASLSYGVYRIHFWHPLQGALAKIALVQPVFQPSEQSEGSAQQYFEALPAYYQQAFQDNADWVIFPPSANPYTYGDDFYFTGFWRRQVGTYGIPLLLNGPHRSRPDRQLDEGAFLLAPFQRLASKQGQTGNAYTGWGWAGLSSVHQVAQGKAAGIRYSALSSADALNAPLARRLASQGAQLLVYFGDGGELRDDSVPLHQLAAARLRAIENRRTILFSSNAGPSARIDPWGRAAPRLDRFSQGLLLAEAGGTFTRSIYSIIGDWLGWLLAAASLAASLLGSRGASAADSA